MKPCIHTYIHTYIHVQDPQQRTEKLLEEEVREVIKGRFDIISVRLFTSLPVCSYTCGVYIYSVSRVGWTLYLRTTYFHYQGSV
jgi:hypothetical protein